MPNAHAHCEQESKRESLMSAAFELFLNNDYNKVSTRQLATRAGTLLSMIPYYFESKQGLYNTMVRKQFKKISMALESAYSEESGLDFNMLMHSYLKIHKKNPDFPAFIMKILIAISSNCLPSGVLLIKENGSNDSSARSVWVIFR